jgi:hypothetical protein
MNPKLSPQQIFAWADQMTQQPDYQALTHYFLGLLQQLPGFKHVAAFRSLWWQRYVRWQDPIVLCC